MCLSGVFRRCLFRGLKTRRLNISWLKGRLLTSELSSVRTYGYVTVSSVSVSESVSLSYMSWGVLSTNEVAKELGVSDARVRQLVASGHLTADRSGRSMLFERDDVERYQASRKPGARESPAARPAPAMTVPSAPVSAVPSPLAESNPVPKAEVKGLQERVEQLSKENERLRAALDQALDLVSSLRGISGSQ